MLYVRWRGRVMQNISSHFISLQKTFSRCLESPGTFQAYLKLCFTASCISRIIAGYFVMCCSGHLKVTEPGLSVNKTWRHLPRIALTRTILSCLCPACFMFCSCSVPSLGGGNPDRVWATFHHLTLHHVSGSAGLSHSEKLPVLFILRKLMSCFSVRPTVNQSGHRR